jgi:hypothetical protein
MLYFLPLCVLILLNLLSPPNIFSESQPFIRQEVKNPPNWTNMLNGSQTKSGPTYTDITSVTYSSDGNFLNSTLWLSSLKDLRDSHWKPNNIYSIAYGVLIDSDLSTASGYQGADYQLEISWNKTTHNWTRTLLEYASSNASRSVIPDTTNYTKFLENIKGNYIPLDLHLNDILSPSKYRLFFYAYSLDNKTLQWLLNGVRWIYIPPPEVKISVSPSFVDLFPAKKETIELNLNNTTNFPANVTLTTPHLPSEVNIEYENKTQTLRLPAASTIKTTLNVKSMTTEASEFHTIDLIGAVSFTSQPFFFPGAKAGVTIEASNVNTTVATLSIKIESTLDLVSQVWNKIGGFFTFIYTPIAAIVGWILYRRYKE